MGAECVRYSPKLAPSTSSHKSKQSSKIRAFNQVLHFEINISDLELHYTANNISRVVFTVQDYASLEFSINQFVMLDKAIKCAYSKKALLSVTAKDIEHLDFNAIIFDKNGFKIQKICLKMHAVCEGPKYHNHLLKQMKARIIYNLEINQLITSVFGCSDYKIIDSNRVDVTQDYGLSLDMIVPQDKDCKETDERKIICNRNPQQSQKYTKNNIPSKKLKQSIYRVSLIKLNNSFSRNQYSEKFIQIPFMKFWNQDQQSVVSQKNGNRTFQKIHLRYNENLRNEDGQIYLNIQLELQVKITKIYLQQIQSMVFSQNGLKVVSPQEKVQTQKQGQNFISVHQLKIYQKLLKKHHKLTYQNKGQIQKILRQFYGHLTDNSRNQICNPNQLQHSQIIFLNILNNLSQLITEGEDVTNQSILSLIDKIIHRPQLSTSSFNLIRMAEQKTEIAFRYYEFIFNMLSKIILCTTMSLTYNQLKCIQKFIGYVYFRCKWVQNLVVKSLKRSDDPEFTEQKLIDIGVSPWNRSQKKSILYDWEQCLLPYIFNDPRYRQISNNLSDISQSVPKWAELLFNRDDQDLYYGLLIEIWTQAQVFLNYENKIMWEYFPHYGELLSTFLAQMNKNQIIDYSSQFSQCSVKLISNQKLINNFVMHLFPKTCLYEINCVTKCLQLISSYFSQISRKNKKLPHEFNFNYFYTGIRSIFESNHSYILVKIIYLLYNNYQILPIQFKVLLDNFIFSKGFNSIFLHWCDYVRKMFYFLLEHRIVLKFHQNQIKNFDKNIYLNQFRQKYHQYQALVQAISQKEQQILRTNQVRRTRQNDQLYIRMKQKLRVKKGNRNKNSFKLVHRNSFNGSQSNELFAPLLQRKQTQWEQQQNQIGKLNRKYSYNQQLLQNKDYFPENLKKYIINGMKEYRKIKTIKNPDQEIKKIIKNLQGNKNIDN